MCPNPIHVNSHTNLIHHYPYQISHHVRMFKYSNGEKTTTKLTILKDSQKLHVQQATQYIIIDQNMMWSLEVTLMYLPNTP